jgi:hypothetical protein
MEDSNIEYDYHANGNCLLVSSLTPDQPLKELSESGISSSVNMDSRTSKVSHQTTGTSEKPIQAVLLKKPPRPLTPKQASESHLSCFRPPSPISPLQARDAFPDESAWTAYRKERQARVNNNYQREWRRKYPDAAVR